MIELAITPEVYQEACKMAHDMGELSGSITKGEGNVAGFVGELLVCQLTGAVPTNTFQHDLTLGSLLLEVKTKQRSKRPVDTYDVDLSARNVKQRADYYVFVSVNYALDYGYVLGCMPKYEYLMAAKFRERGEDDRGFAVKASCFTVPIKQLMPIEELQLAKALRAAQSN